MARNDGLFGRAWRGEVSRAVDVVEFDAAEVGRLVGHGAGLVEADFRFGDVGELGGRASLDLGERVVAFEGGQFDAIHVGFGALVDAHGRHDADAVGREVVFELHAVHGRACDRRAGVGHVESSGGRCGGVRGDAEDVGVIVHAEVVANDRDGRGNGKGDVDRAVGDSDVASDGRDEVEHSWGLFLGPPEVFVEVVRDFRAAEVKALVGTVEVDEGLRGKVRVGRRLVRAEQHISDEVRGELVVCHGGLLG